MSDFPIAYHITVGTYGTRLHGDDRGTVDRRQNEPGDPIIGRCKDWSRMERRVMRFEPVLLTPEQRVFIEQKLLDICERGGWTFHIAAARVEHYHVMLSSSNDGEIIRRILKRWLSQTLSEMWPMERGRAWWAECGSVKWVWKDWYLDNLYRYIDEQRTLR
jgi:hypothetical protein